MKEMEIQVLCTCKMNFFMTLYDVYMHFFKETFVQHHARTDMEANVSSSLMAAADMEACCRIYVEIVVNWTKYDTDFWMNLYLENIEKLEKSKIVNQWKFTYSYYP